MGIDCNWCYEWDEYIKEVSRVRGLAFSLEKKEEFVRELRR